MKQARSFTHLVMTVLAGCAVSFSAEAKTAASGVGCQANVGKRVALVDFATVFASVPEFQPKGAYESTAQFEARMTNVTNQPVVIEVARDADAGLIYDADEQTLAVYDSAFGGGKGSYHSIRNKLAKKPQQLADDIAFDIERVVASKDSYSTTNGFGAQVQVSKTTYSTKVIWEAQIPWGKKPFTNQKSLIVAQIPLSPNAAKDLVEKGLVALQIVPQFKTNGLWFTTATFQIPFETVHQQDVITGDIQCGYILHADSTVAYAFDVK